MKGVFGGVVSLVAKIGNLINTGFLKLFLGRSYPNPKYIFDYIIGAFITLFISTMIISFFPLNSFEVFSFGLTLIIFLFFLIVLDTFIEEYDKFKDKN